MKAGYYWVYKKTWKNVDWEIALIEWGGKNMCDLLYMVGNQFYEEEDIKELFLIGDKIEIPAKYRELLNEEEG